MPRRVGELLLGCIQGKRLEESRFAAANGKSVRDFRLRWEQECAEAGVRWLHVCDLRRTAHSMRRGNRNRERKVAAVGSRLHHVAALVEVPGNSHRGRKKDPKIHN
jgi:hypothetical protein